MNVLKTSIEEGLSDNNVQDMVERTNEFGKNEPIIKKPKSIMTLIIDCYGDIMLQIISVAAVVSLFTGIAKDGWEHGWMEGVAILCAVIIIIVFTAGNDYMSQKQF